MPPLQIFALACRACYRPAQDESPTVRVPADQQASGHRIGHPTTAPSTGPSLAHGDSVRTNDTDENLSGRESLRRSAPPTAHGFFRRTNFRSHAGDAATHRS